MSGISSEMHGYMTYVLPSKLLHLLLNQSRVSRNLKVDSNFQRIDDARYWFS